MLAMKKAIIALSVVLLLTVCAFVCASMIGVVGFHYPRVIPNEPLRQPQKVISVQGTNLFLESGTIIAIDTLEASDISNKLHQSGFEIDVEDSSGGPVAIYARQDGWVCGTPWAQPIRIPLIPDTTYRNRRELIALGSYLISNGQQVAAANWSQPIRTQTNSTSSAAGSRR